jgi:hypothetical protein
MIKNDFYFWQDFGESANSEAFPGALLASYQDASYPRVHRVQTKAVFSGSWPTMAVKGKVDRWMLMLSPLLRVNLVNICAIH